MRRIVGDLVLVYDAAPIDVAIGSRVRGMEWNVLNIAQAVEPRKWTVTGALSRQDLEKRFIWRKVIILVENRLHLGS